MHLLTCNPDQSITAYDADVSGALLWPTIACPPELQGADLELYRHVDGVVERKSDEKIAAILAARAEAQAASDLAKYGDLWRTHNNFLLLCEALTGSREKLGFEEIQTRLEALAQTDPMTENVLFQRLSGVNQAGLRYGGNQWWDDCVWHPEVAK